MSGTPILVRFMEKADLEDVLACEFETHGYIDPDFDVFQMSPLAWSKNEIVAAVGQYRSSTKGTCDTRAVVAEAMLACEDENGLIDTVPWVCGAMIYEIQPDGYEVLFLTHQPKGPQLVRETLLAKLLSKAEASEKRKKLTMLVTDGDYETLALLQEYSWSIKLVTNLWGDDHWHCEYNLPQEESVEHSVS